MTNLRATTHLADGANEMFAGWIRTLAGQGFAIAGGPGDDTTLDADVVFACGLLTVERMREGQPLTVVGAPVFAGETEAVYRSVLVMHKDSAVEGLTSGAALRLAVNEYGSWSGWHGLKEHLRNSGVAPDVLGAHVVTGGHVDSIEAVLGGEADLASIDSSVWNSRRCVDTRLGDLRAFATTRHWPAPPISVRSDLPENVGAELTDAILMLPDIRPAREQDYAFMLAELDGHPSWP